MKTNLLLILIASLLAGCTTSRQVSSQSSQVDENHVAMRPGLIASGKVSPAVRLGGFWNPKMGDEMMLIAQHEGNVWIGNLQFNIDGKIVTLVPSDKFSEFSYQDFGQYSGRPYASQRFVAPLSLARHLVNAKKAMVRLDVDKGHVEGTFAKGVDMAGTSFAKFLAQVEKLKAK